MQPGAFAQETTAGIQGTVKDAQGGTVPGATVEVTSPALIGKKEVKTDSTGVYRFTNLPPGEYTLTITAPNFRTYKRTGIDLSAGRLPTIDVQLEIGITSQVVEVSAAAPIVDVTESKAAVTVTRDILDVMPKGRSFQSVIPFAPGARQEPLQSTARSVLSQGGAGRSGGFQIDGASDSENTYMVEGMDTTDIQNGGVGANVPMEFIQEVQIKSSSFEAEYGGALGGVINAIPKRGSNVWHGEFLTYLRTNALNANDPCASGYTSGGAGTFAGFSTVCGLRLDPTKAGLSSSTRLDGTPEYYVPNKDKRRILEPGFQIAGPIFRDRLFLYTSYIPTIDTISRTTTFTGNNPGPRTLSSNFIQHNAYTKLDYRLLNSLNLFAGWNYSYSRTKGTLGSPDSAYGQVNTGASTDPNTLRSDNGSVNPLSVYTFGGDWTPTSRLVVSARPTYETAASKPAQISMGDAPQRSTQRPDRVAVMIKPIEATVIIDHIGRTDVSEGPDGAAFTALRRLLDKGNVWVKLSGIDRVTKQGPPHYRDAVALARVLARQAPQRILWGTDWPHPNVNGPMPNDGDLVDAIAEIAEDETTRRRMLVDNPAELFRFG